MGKTKDGDPLPGGTSLGSGSERPSNWERPLGSLVYPVRPFQRRLHGGKDSLHCTFRFLVRGNPNFS